MKNSLQNKLINQLAIIATLFGFITFLGIAISELLDFNFWCFMFCSAISATSLGSAVRIAFYSLKEETEAENEQKKHIKNSNEFKGFM